MRAVNLLPLDARLQNQRRSTLATLNPTRVVRVGGAAAAVLAVLLGGLYVHERSSVHSKQQALAKTTSQVASLQTRVTKIQATQNQAQARLKIVQGVATTRMNWDRTLMDLARVIPSGVYLTSLTVTSPTTAAVSTAAPVTTFTVAGSAPSHVGTAGVLDRLALLPWLTNVELQTSGRQSDGTVTFSIQGTVTSGGVR
ncbi:MAG TPA: PilN domain-containing protein [Gaiellaceae bacterium]|jgi:Tfp pilus assembly protein PilN